MAVQYYKAIGPSVAISRGMNSGASSRAIFIESNLNTRGTAWIQMCQTGTVGSEKVAQTAIQRGITLEGALSLSTREICLKTVPSPMVRSVTI
jgi:hypothetical protein